MNPQDRKIHPSHHNDSTIQSQGRKRNVVLTDQERMEKKKYKKQIKLQAKLKTLRTRIKHSIHRKDPIVEAQARKDLEVFLKQEESTLQQLGLVSDYCFDGGNASSNARNASEEAQPLILEISNKLFNCPEAQSALHQSGKQTQVDVGVKLLRHMTKGTQEISMFNNQSCWGYCRQKFYERALLLCNSLYKLSGSQEELDLLLQSKSEDVRAVIEKQWNDRATMFTKARAINRVFSIGCGPGNDMVGLITFLRLIHGENFNGLKDAFTLDWSIGEWRQSILEPLQGILDECNLVTTMTPIFCDVTKDLSHESNEYAKSVISSQSQTSQVDIYLISYLLSETRGKWEPFFKDIVHMSSQGSLFYFAEPTSWQLHRLIELFSHSLTFVWVDSSRDYPDLQRFEKRTGPAVLFAKKR
jgi:hypothetical protein